MSGMFLKAVNMSIAAGWIVLVAAALRLLLKRAPKWISVLLWGVVALRLVCPFSIESALSLIPSAETIPERVLRGPSFQVRTGLGPVDRQVNDYLRKRYFEGVTVPVQNGLNFVTALSAIWIAGSILLLFYMIFSYWRLRRQVSTAVRLQEGIFQSEHVSSPFVLGVLKPKIYLPFGMEERELEYVTAHERAHIRRRDHWWKPLGFVLLTVYWFNPLMWLAYGLLCRDIEMACDEKVVRELGAQQRAEYSQALLACSVPRRGIAVCPLAFGEVGVRERIRSVLSYKKPAFWVAGAALAICAAVAVCFLTDPKDGSETSQLFGHSYRVEEILYDAPWYSFTYTVDTAPKYYLPADYELFVSGDLLGGSCGDDFMRASGEFRKVKLTKENFDDCFKSADQVSGWRNDQEMAASLRRENKNAWYLEEEGENRVCYYLLEQKNGDAYLAYGYCSPEGESGSESGLRWLFRLARADLRGSALS